MSEFSIKVHKSQRLGKIEKRQDKKAERMMTPPKLTNKNSMMNRYNKFESQMGYDYDPKGNTTLKWMKEEYNQKMGRYLGKK